MRTLLTGATGFVGAALARRLQAQGADVSALVRVPLAPPQAPAISAVCVGEPWSAADFGAALAGVATVVHLAARVHVMRDAATDPLAAFRAVNVAATLNLARQAAASGVKRFVFVSSVKVNGEYTLPMHAFTEADPPSPQDAYGLSKSEAELGLRALEAKTGMEMVIIRPPLVYGPGVKANFAALAGAVQRGWPLPLGAIHNRRSLVALDNLVDMIVTCLSHAGAAGQIFLVSDGHDLSTTELVQGLGRAIRVPARLIPVPAWALRAGAGLLGRGDAVHRLCGNLQVDISKARSLLGWVPPVSVEDGLRRAVAGF